ncbi:hypothetical protein [Gaoshiqia sp. Z1-71]|uniref:hypothetical protein n=1 Tax=Gaoshiqia hydrogeniformans TaxID=3290090 RepID=UPI003BF7A46D
MEKIFTKWLSLRLTPSDLHDVGCACKKNKLTRSEFIRELIKKELEKEENDAENKRQE